MTIHPKAHFIFHEKIKRLIRSFAIVYNTFQLLLFPAKLFETYSLMRDYPASVDNIHLRSALC